MHDDYLCVCIQTKTQKYIYTFVYLYGYVCVYVCTYLCIRMAKCVYVYKDYTQLTVFTIPVEMCHSSVSHVQGLKASKILGNRACKSVHISMHTCWSWVMASVTYMITYTD
jgi:hypothetical protein